MMIGNIGITKHIMKYIRKSFSHKITIGTSDTNLNMEYINENSYDVLGNDK
jgi:hypothetical protein